MYLRSFIGFENNKIGVFESERMRNAIIELVTQSIR